MKLTKGEAKKLKKIIQVRGIKIWISAIFITGAIILIQAILCKWLIGLLGIELKMSEAIIVVILSNLIIGFYKGFKLYGKAKKTIKKAS